MHLDQIGEFGLIQRIQKKWTKTPRSVLVGIGDDAAAIALPSSKKNILLLTTDTLLEQTHFTRATSTFFQVGYKAVSVNVSDIAAMGGTPRFFLVSLGLTGKETVADIDRLYRGINTASRDYGITLIGGNITRSRAGFFISLTVSGEVAKKKIVTRSGGTEGDALYVTGTLGNAAAGLEMLQAGGKRRHTSGVRSLILKHQMPKARFREAQLLAQKKIPSAMIDLSDGLSSDLSHLTKQSGIGAELEIDKIPISPALRRYAKSIGTNPIRYALHGGEEYELLFSVPQKSRAKLDQLVQKGEISAHYIGRLSGKTVSIKTASGQIFKMKPAGFDHLKKGKPTREQ